MAGVKKKKRRRSTVAIPCLIVMLVTLTIFGIGALYLYNSITEERDKTQTDSLSLGYEAKPEDDATILFIVDFDDEALKKTFFLMRAIVTEREFVIVPIAGSMRLEQSGSDTTADRVYSTGGANTLRKAVAEKLDVEINKFVVLGDTAFSKIIDSMGGVNYVVPDGLKGINEGNQFLAAEQVKTVITNEKFLSEEQRTQVAGTLVTKLIGDTKGNRVGIVAEGVFNELINVMETNITKFEFANQLKAIKYAFEDNKYSAYCRIPDGSSTIDGYFDVKDEFITSLKGWFNLEE